MTSYILLSLPLRTFDTGDKDEAIQALGATVSAENGTVMPFPIPAFKIGTLDALVQQADELAKLHTGCEGVVQRVSDALKNVLDGDEDKIAQNKMVNDSEAEPASSTEGGGNTRLIPSQSPRISTCGHSAGTRSGIDRTGPWQS